MFLSSNLSPNQSNVMSISSPNSIKFIEDALLCASPFALSYTDPDQKWIIREHLISLFQDFPSLRPAVGVLTHNDGADVRLFNAHGELRVSAHAPSVPLTVWVHELYPHMAPIVYIRSGIQENYPFADPSGATTSSYLMNWRFAKSDLSGLARSLTKLFSYSHPFHYSGRCSGWAHPSAFSKMEAMDRLACSIYDDVAAIMAKTQQEIVNLSAIRFELKRRGETLENVTRKLEEERRMLKERREEVCGESDRLMNWLKVYEGNNSGLSGIDDAFQVLDGRSETILECCAADLAVEDLMYKLDKAVQEGGVGFDVYMKVVRFLAREQFQHRAKRKKIEELNHECLQLV